MQTGWISPLDDDFSVSHKKGLNILLSSWADFAVDFFLLWADAHPVRLCKERKVPLLSHSRERDGDL